MTVKRFMKTQKRLSATERRGSWRNFVKRKWGLFSTGALLSILVLSCVTVNRTILAPPSIPGATFVGSETCADCHDTITRDFSTATHAGLKAEGENATEIGCESCHGPASIHVESGGAFHTIVNPQKSPSVCFQCHLDKRGQFNLPSHHNLANGEVTCSDCHDVHKGPALRGGAASLARADETCLQCHPAQRGPFVFEHEAMREGCVVCHEPHGSVNARMLTERNANLCLKCHFQQRGSSVMIGGFTHNFPLSRGTCWTAGCHEAVHGSQVSTSLRF